MKRVLLAGITILMAGCGPAPPTITMTLPPTSEPTVTLAPPQPEALLPADLPTRAPQATSTLRPTPTVQPDDTPISHDMPELSAEAQELLARLNRWRLNEGLWPLRPNTLLTELAQAQADFLAPQTVITDFHAGPQGNDARQRAINGGWPSYDAARESVSATEIVVAAKDPAGAVEWWRGSSTHSWVVEQALYREAGVGIAEREFSTMYVVMVGSRPNVLPTLLDPLTDTLYLTSERYSGGYNGLIGDVSGYQLLQALADPIDSDGWQPYSVRMPLHGELPQAAAYTDGTHVALSTVEEVLLPHTVPVLQGELVLVYDEYGLTLINQGENALDLRALRVGGSLAWGQRRLRPGDCVQAAPPGIDPPLPAACDRRRALEAVQPFWMAGRFSVWVESQRMVQCASEDGLCATITPIIRTDS